MTAMMVYTVVPTRGPGCRIILRSHPQQENGGNARREEAAVLVALTIVAVPTAFKELDSEDLAKMVFK